MKRFLLLILCGLSAASQARDGDVPGQFDYYVLALSWSPQHCAEKPDDKAQCDVKRKRKLGFVLHGLWPQYKKGFPGNCTVERFDARLKDDYAGLYPNDKLFFHEWKKHGTCSGLAQRAYLDLSQKLKDSVVIPADYQNPDKSFRVTARDTIRAFHDSNKGLAAKSVAVFCSRNKRFLREVFVCFDKAGEKTIACSSKVLRRAQKSCDKAGFVVRNIR